MPSAREHLRHRVLLPQDLATTGRLLRLSLCAAAATAAMASCAVLSSDRSSTALGLLIVEWFALGGIAGFAVSNAWETPSSSLPPSKTQLRRGFPSDFYLEVLSESQRKVRILDTYSTLLSDDRLRPEFLRQLRRAALRSDVQILLLDSEATIVGLRAAALEASDGEAAYRRDIEANLRALYQLEQELRTAGPDTRFQIRLIDRVPAVASYQCDDHLLLAIRPPTRRAEQTAQSWIRTNSEAGRFVAAMFKNLWEGAATLDERLFCHIRCPACGHHPARFITSGASQHRPPSAYLSLDPVAAHHVLNRDVTISGLPNEEGTRADATWRISALDVADNSREWEEAAVALHDKYRDIEGDGQLVRLVAPPA